MQSLNLIFEARPYKPGVGPVTVRMSGAYNGDDKGTQLDGYQWDNLIVSGPTYGFNFTSDQDGRLNEGTTDLGNLSFRIGDFYDNEEWSTYEWNNAACRLWIGETGQTFSAYRKLYEATCSGLERDEVTATIALRALTGRLSKPLLNSTYAGTGKAEGPTTMKGNVKPIAIGPCTSVEPMTVDAAKWIFQIHGYGPVQDIVEVYDFAQPVGSLAASVNTYDELAALTLKPAEWAKCNALGMFRLGGATDKKITADVQGALFDGQYYDTVADIAPALIRLAGFSASKVGSFTALPNKGWSFYSTDEASIGDVVRKAVFDAGGYLITDNDGKWQVGNAFAPKTAKVLKADSSEGLTVGSIRELNVADPIGHVILGHTPCWGVHSTSDISPKLLELAGSIAEQDEALKAIKDTADLAKAQSDAAELEISNIVRDDKLDRGEKVDQQTDLEEAAAQRREIASKISQYQVGSAWSEYVSAHDALKAYLAPLLADMNVASTIDRATFRARWAAYHEKHQAVTNAMTGDARTVSTWKGVTGADKPEDNATKGAPEGTYVAGKPATELVQDTEDAKGKANTAVDALKDGSGAIRPVRDLFAEAKTASDAAVADAKKAGTDAQAQITQARTDIAKDVTAAKQEGTTARSEAKKAIDDLAAEVTRAKGAEGTLTTNLASVKQTADNAATAITDEATLRTNNDNALVNRLVTVESRSGGARGLNANGDFADAGRGWTGNGFTFPANAGTGYTASSTPGVYCNLFSDKRIKVTDLNRGLRLHVVYTVYAGRSRTYTGLQCFDVAGNHVGNIYAVMATHNAGSYKCDYLYQGVISGATNPVFGGGPKLPEGTFYVQPLFFANYPDDIGTQANSYTQIAEMWLEDVGSVQQVDAKLTDETTARTTADTAITTRLATTEAKLDGTQDSKIAANVRDETTARVGADNALGGRIQKVEADYVTNGAAATIAAGKVSEEATARTNADNALGTRLSTTEAQFRGEQDSALKTLINNNRKNLIDVGWWKKGVTIPWGLNGGRQNVIYTLPDGANGNIAGPDGSSSDVWLCQADAGGGAAGGWNNGPMERLDPDKTYRFTLPIATLGELGRVSYWGTSGVCNLNTTTENGNPYFAYVGNLTTNRWHLFVGYIYPRNSTAKTNDGAGVWDMTTGIKVADGWNYCFHPDGRQPIHRAYQYYAADQRYQAFGRPIVELVDGTELNIAATLSAAKKATQADARITDEATASVNRDSALGTRINTTEAQLNGGQDSWVAARVRDEATASVNRDNALTSRATALESRGTQAGNLVPNSSLIAGRTNDVIPGWTYWGSGNFDRRQVNAPDTNYYLSNENVFCSHKNNGSDGQYGEWASDFIPVIGGDWYQYHALANSHRCTVTVFLYCYDANKNLIANTTTVVGANQGALGYALGHYVRVGSVCEQVPPATAWVRLMLRQNDTTPGQGDSWAWFLHPYVSRARQGQTEWNAYSTGTDRPSTTDTKARIEDVSTTLTNADAALSSRINTTEAQLSGGQDSWVAARIRDEATASANRDNALTGRANTIEAATLAGAGVARNDKFALWKDGAQYPDGWYTWVGEGNYRIERNTGIAGSPYCVRTLNDYAETSGGFMQVVPVYAGKWVVEVTAESDTSGFRGAGMTLHGQHSIDFCSDPDTNGFSGDKASTVRSWSKAFDFTQDFINSIGGNVNFHAMWGWLGFGRGTAAKYMRWHRMVLKPAGLGDAEAIRANARITTEETTRTTQYNALATRSTDLEAQVVNDGTNLLRNGTFNAPGWVPNTGIPPYWGGWANEYGAYIGAYSGGGSKYGAKYPLQIDRGGNNNGIHQRLPAQGAGWYAVEVDVTAEDGNWLGSGFHWNFQDAQGHAIDFGRDQDTNGGVVQGNIGSVNRKFSKLVYVGFAPAFINCYLMAGWEGFSTGQGFLRTIWHKVSFRMASEAEIAAKKVLDANIIARVQSSEGAIANVQTKVATAWSEKTVSAGTSSATIMMRAVDDNGNATSDVTLAASRIALRNTETGGISKGGMVMSGGNAVFDGSITANGGILVGNGKLKVQVQAQDYAVSHGQRVDFGYDLGRAPNITFGPCPVALNSGEVYAPYASDLSATGFTAQLVINSAPQSAGQTTGAFTNQGNNTWDGGKQGKPNAANGTYTLTVNLQATAPAYADGTSDYR